MAEKKCPECGAETKYYRADYVQWECGTYRTVVTGITDLFQSAVCIRTYRLEADLKAMRVTKEEWDRAFHDGITTPEKGLMHIVTETLDNRRKVERLKAQVLQLEAEVDAYKDAIAEVRAWYPEDVFPRDGRGGMARMTCDNITEIVEKGRTTDD